MAEDAEEAEPGAEAFTASADSPAVSLALHGASRSKADAFLAGQTALIADQRNLMRLQTEDLARELRLRHWTLMVRHVSGLLKLALEVSFALLALAFTFLVGAAVWNAAHADGLIIESFSVPPDLVQRGLTGQVVAGRLLANLSAFQAQTVSARAASSYLNNWGDDIKVEIPETGVSIGEFNRFLRVWLGHETHITGAVYRTAAGIAVSVSAGNDAGATFTGSDAELERLLQEAAGAVYRSTQPFRYAVHLMNTGHVPEAETAFQKIVADGPVKDRAWGYDGLADIYIGQANYRKAAEAAQSALTLRPEFLTAYLTLTEAEFFAEHDEAAIAAGKAAVALGQSKRDPDISERGWETERLGVQSHLAAYRGDYRTEIALLGELTQLPEVAGSHESSRRLRMSAFAGMHDAADSYAAYAELPPSENPRVNTLRIAYKAVTDLQLGDRSTLLGARAALESGISKLLPNPIPYKSLRLWPAEAYAMAQSGEFAGAHALIDKTPADCIACLRMRGRIDALQENWGGAGYWFGRAAQDAPSTPFPFTDWGLMLLAKGDLDGAIDKFKMANQEGPRFADPLEGWGEALMLKNRSDLALAKFEEAAKFAPRWGRIHLKWGEALRYAGKAADAKRQFDAADHLDLAADEKAELRGKRL